MINHRVSNMTLSYTDISIFPVKFYKKSYMKTF